MNDFREIDQLAYKSFYVDLQASFFATPISSIPFVRRQCRSLISEQGGQQVFLQNPSTHAYGDHLNLG